MSRQDAQDAWIEKIVGDDDELTFQQCLDRFYQYLQSNLQLPCTVTGVEDFRWEEFYVFGPGDRDEYERLRKDQPSFQDQYDLLRIEQGAWSEWMMFYDEDIAGHVRRRSDGKEFLLGLAEIKAIDKKSKNYQLLNDYAVWFVNNR